MLQHLITIVTDSEHWGISKKLSVLSCSNVYCIIFSLILVCKVQSIYHSKYKKNQWIPEQTGESDVYIIRWISKCTNLTKQSIKITSWSDKSACFLIYLILYYLKTYTTITSSILYLY